MRSVRDAYRARAVEYVQVCGTIEAAAAPDREIVTAWARGVNGPIVDLGCGPGQWTALLHDNGANVVGIDPVPEFIADAQRQYPGVHYRIGHTGDLGLPLGSQSGVLAWFSLIHIHPDDIDRALGDVASVLQPGGRLLVGYFEGSKLDRFDHKVHPAWRWPTPDLSHRLESAGFSVLESRTRFDPTVSRRVGSLSAVLRTTDLGRTLSAPPLVAN